MSFKRAFDSAGACAGLLVFAPVMVIIIVVVLLDDGWPVIIRQERLGYRRRPFSIIKFRTMRNGRTTRAGRVLRATLRARFRHDGRQRASARAALLD